MLAAIRTELLVQTNNKTLHKPHIQTLLSIAQLLTYLEGKGKRPNTVLAYKKNLHALAIRADLNNPPSVELAIARYKCIDLRTRKLTDRPASNNYKSKLRDCYATYCRFCGLTWEKPIHTPEPTSIQPLNAGEMFNVINRSERRFINQNRPKRPNMAKTLRDTRGNRTSSKGHPHRHQNSNGKNLQRM
jgi:hypothetical protein